MVIGTCGYFSSKSESITGQKLTRRRERLGEGEDTVLHGESRVIRPGHTQARLRFHLLYSWETDPLVGSIILLPTASKALITVLLLTPKGWDVRVPFPLDTVDTILRYSRCTMSHGLALERESIPSTTFVLFGQVTSNREDMDGFLIYLLTRFLHKKPIPYTCSKIHCEWFKSIFHRQIHPIGTDRALIRKLHFLERFGNLRCRHLYVVCFWKSSLPSTFGRCLLKNCDTSNIYRV